MAISFRGDVSSVIEQFIGLYGGYKHHWQVFDFQRMKTLISTSIPQKDIILCLLYASNGLC